MSFNPKSRTSNPTTHNLAPLHLTVMRFLNSYVLNMQSGSSQPPMLSCTIRQFPTSIHSQYTIRQFSTSHVLNVASPQAPPRFYLAAVEKNQEKARDQNYIMIGNGGLGYYILWTQFCNDGNVPTHNVAGIDQFNPPWCFSHSYGFHRYQVTNKRCVGTSGRRFVCTLTERSNEKAAA